MQSSSQQQQLLLDLVKAIMPFGKYKGRKLIDLPEYYLVWYKQKGFPKGKLGDQMGLMYEIKLNGLEYLLSPLRKGSR
jgi:uncharacterized protein (DUF3820 family)